jgi:hypothetical protein
VGTGLTAYFAVEFWRYQIDEQDDKRANELLKALVAELYATRDRMNTATNATQIISDPSGNEEAVSVVITDLEPTACEEAIRAALFEPKSANNLTYLSRVMREYTKLADILRFSISKYPVDDFPVSEARTYMVAKNVKLWQLFVIHWCDTVLEKLEEQGMEMPPEEPYYSVPEREASSDFFRYN